MPVRIQRKRVKGWKAPAGAVNCTRPGPWGNPFRIGGWYMKGDPGGHSGPLRFTYTEAYEGYQDERYTKIQTAEEAVAWFRWYVGAAGMRDRIKAELKGKDLMCFCSPESACHVDVLLEIANG